MAVELERVTRTVAGQPHLVDVDLRLEPGTMVSTPAAVSTPQSMPAALTVRVIVATMGLLSTEVRVRAKSSSTQLNMKQKNAVTPTPALIKGRKILMKNAGNE